MDIKLAGFNIDRDAIDELKRILSEEELSNEERLTALDILSNLTSETICASYARISRDPRLISELREEARKDVEASRKTDKAIIFGAGHKSIAEHARFNFDIVGISRKAVEAVEQGRLDSYTEKSQRYITMEGDFVLPKEIKNTKFEPRFLELVELQNNFYKKNLEKITDWHHSQDYSALYNALGCDIKPKDTEKETEKKLKKQHETREGLGKEDARYSLGLATQAQLGMTVSARTLENLITRLRSSDIEELKEIGEKLFNEVDGVAPSVIKYTKPSDYFSKTRPELKEFVSRLVKKVRLSHLTDNERVKLYEDLIRDDSIRAGLIFSSSNLNYSSCYSLLYGYMSDKDIINLSNHAIKYQTRHDPMLREYELGDRVAEMTMSSSAFAQIKRHRMNTLIPQEYNPLLGITLPESVEETNLERELENIAEKSKKLYDDIIKGGYSKDIAEYCLTNAHRRRVLFDANNRQAHAFCMERENLAAQWDIRKTANEYHKALQKSSDSRITTRALCGKHEFEDMKKRILKK